MAERSENRSVVKWLESLPLWALALVIYTATAVLFGFLMPERPEVASAIAMGGGVQALICWWLWGGKD